MVRHCLPLPLFCPNAHSVEWFCLQGFLGFCLSTPCPTSLSTPLCPTDCPPWCPQCPAGLPALCPPLLSRAHDLSTEGIWHPPFYLLLEPLLSHPASAKEKEKLNALQKIWSVDVQFKPVGRRDALNFNLKFKFKCSWEDSQWMSTWGRTSCFVPQISWKLKFAPVRRKSLPRRQHSSKYCHHHLIPSL